MNSRYRCLGCQQHCRRPEYRRVGLGAVCSPQCLAALRHDRTGARKRPANTAGSDIPGGVRAQVLARDKHRCRCCGTTTGLHVHHINLRSQGIDHQPHNLIVLCEAHHRMVHADTRYWQPLLRRYIWERYVGGRLTTIPVARSIPMPG